MASHLLPLTLSVTVVIDVRHAYIITLPALFINPSDYLTVTGNTLTVTLTAHFIPILMAGLAFSSQKNCTKTKKRLKAFCLESLLSHFSWRNWYIFRVRKTKTVFPTYKMSLFRRENGHIPGPPTGGETKLAASPSIRWRVL